MLTQIYGFKSRFSINCYTITSVAFASFCFLLDAALFVSRYGALSE